MPHLRLFLLAAPLVLILGCVPPPLLSPLPPPLALREVAAVDGGAPFAVAPDGGSVVYSRNGARMKSLSGGAEAVLSDSTPAAFAWAPDGQSVAAAFPGGDEATVVVYGRDARELARTRVAAAAVALGWTGDRLLVLGTGIRRFSFGAHIRVVLHRWRPGTAPVTETLHEATLRPSTLKSIDVTKSIRFAVSPWGDEILYTQLHDPPQFLPSLRLVLRHLVTGEEKLLDAAVPLSADAIYTADGEGVIAGTGEAETSVIDPWTAKERPLLAAAGNRLARSSGGTYILAGPTLYRDGVSVASFAPDAVGAFAGDSLFVATGSRLYLVSGFSAEPAPLPRAGEARSRILSLRDWRSKNLLTPAEYRTTIERLLGT